MSPQVLFRALAFLGLACIACGAEPANKPNIIADSLGIKLVLIPAGEFLMGSHESLDDIEKRFPGHDYKQKVEDKTYDADEWPQHRVRITKPFRLAIHEVTVGQFRKFVEATGYKTDAETSGKGAWGINKETGEYEGRDLKYSWQFTNYPLTDDHPVVNVSWNDATAFTEWLAKKEGKNYRLPTEAEWEYSCRAGSKTRYATGDDPESLAGFANIADASSIKSGEKQFPYYGRFALKASDGHFTPAPVGSFKPNAFGIHDMHGNVWEWCQDVYEPDYYAKSPVDDPKGQETGRLRVRRGAAFHTYPIFVRSSFRNWNTPTTRYLNLGFRVARDEP
jgi:sulfatase modifying factor 1